MPPPDPAADLALLEEAVTEAAPLALDRFRKTQRQWDKPGGAGPVTEADLAVDAALHARLTAARPGYGWLSEETVDTPARLTRPSAFIVDPIDGTRAFIDGQATWAISAAVVHLGTPVAAIVALPARGMTYTATSGGGATLNRAPLTASTRERLSGAAMLATKWALQPHFWPGGVPEVTPQSRPSLAYRLALIGEGRFDAMVTLRDTWEWDIAAGALIATEAGARVTDRHGAALTFNTPSALSPGVFAAAPALHADLVKRHR